MDHRPHDREPDPVLGDHAGRCPRCVCVCMFERVGGACVLVVFVVCMRVCAYRIFCACVCSVCVCVVCVVSQSAWCVQVRGVWRERGA